jgi:hypothetical protein
MDSVKKGKKEIWKVREGVKFTARLIGEVRHLDSDHILPITKSVVSGCFMSFKTSLYIGFRALTSHRIFFIALSSRFMQPVFHEKLTGILHLGSSQQRNKG